MRVIVVLFALILATPLSVANHCTTHSTTTPFAEVAGVYWVREACQPGCFLGESWWIYEESNGIPGLQRNDEVVDDTCHGSINGDTILF